MGNKTVSIKDIAQKSGVSVATVSRVINQNGRFSVDTEAKVRKVMEEYDYIPNYLARGLRKMQIPEIGILIPDITNEFFGKLVVMIEEELFKHGYTLTICNTNENKRIEKLYLDMIRAKQMSGLICISHQYNKQQHALNIPTVYLDRIPENASYSENSIWVESDHEYGGYLAAKELVEKKCRRIGVILLDSEVSTNTHRRRFTGFRRALEEHNTEYFPEIVVHVKKADYENGRKAISTLINQNKNFDGIFCTSDLLAIGALDELLIRNIKVPDDVKIIGYDDMELAKMAKTSVTTIKQSMKKMVDITCGYLISQLGGDKEFNRYNKKNVVEVELIRRDTT